MGIGVNEMKSPVGVKNVGGGTETNGYFYSNETFELMILLRFRFAPATLFTFSLNCITSFRPLTTCNDKNRMDRNVR